MHALINKVNNNINIIYKYIIIIIHVRTWDTVAFCPVGLFKFLCLLFLLFTFYLNPNKIRLSRRNNEIILIFT